ncbi:MAG: GTP-binding protein [Dictyoglomus sp. NZ13-RE01]|nr:MAG: GTP-binding protein [Dictyoglomus sp. NZ13-RE01]
MPANLTPQYLEAEKRYREAKTLEDKIQALKEMLALLPKHKGTDKMKAELRRKLSELLEEYEKHPKRGGKGYDYYIEKEGAGQVVLIGPPNSGKSTLFKNLTGVQTLIADYPFSTISPTVGMLPYENINIQLVDLPPLWENSENWVFNIIKNADLSLIVLNIEEDILESYESLKRLVEGKKIKLVKKVIDKDPYSPIKEVKGIILINKIDLIYPMEPEEIELLKEELNCYVVSAQNGINLENLKKIIFEELEIVRVYTKRPGYPPNLDKPFILPKGSTVLDVAEMIHKDLAKNLRYARLFTKDGSVKGIFVEKNYQVKDEDILEIH